MREEAEQGGCAVEGFARAIKQLRELTRIQP
jgi:hypothetical protein